MKKLTLGIALSVISGFAAAECPEWSAYQIGFLCDPMAAWENRGETKPVATQPIRRLNANTPGPRTPARQRFRQTSVNGISG